jgi:hypothetical protein
MGCGSQLGGAFGQQGPSIAAPPPPPPPPKQPRPSMADDIVASIFGDPNPGMVSSALESLHHTIAPPFFDSSMYTEPILSHPIGMTSMVERSDQFALTAPTASFFRFL